MSKNRLMDLNLLRVFGALMEEGSVTRAASRLSITQSGVSNALSRLRQAFDDRLFVRAASGVTPTLRATELWQSFSKSLELVDAAIDTESFHAQHCAARIGLIMSDHVASAVLPQLIGRLQVIAPLVQVHTTPNSGAKSLPKLLMDGKIDFCIGVITDALRPSFMRSRILWPLDHVLVMREGHALAAQPRIELNDFLDAGHVDVSLPGKTSPVYDLFLASRDLKRNLVATVNYYHAAFEIVRKTDLIAVLPVHLSSLEPVSSQGLVLMAPPLPPPPYFMELFWHERHEASAVHSWMKGLLVQMFGQQSR